MNRGHVVPLINCYDFITSWDWLSWFNLVGVRLDTISLFLNIQKKRELPYYSVEIKIKRFGDVFGSSYVSVKIVPKDLEPDVDYKIKNYIEDEHREGLKNVPDAKFCSILVH